MARTPGANLSRIAAAHGYYDQPHLVREFQALAGCSPTAWIAEEFGNIQAGHWAKPPDSQP
jgi:AraC-like DNA-binding protein